MPPRTSSGSAAASVGSRHASDAVSSVVLSVLDDEQPVVDTVSGSAGAVVLLLHGAMTRIGFIATEVNEMEIIAQSPEQASNSRSSTDRREAETESQPQLQPQQDQDQEQLQQSTTREFPDSARSSSSNEPGPVAIEGWNASPDAFSFTYRHPRSSLRFLMKALRLGPKLLVTAMALTPEAVSGAGSERSGSGSGDVNDSPILSMEISLADEVDSKYLFRENNTSSTTSWASVFRRPADLLQKFFDAIVAPLMPDLVVTSQGGDSGQPGAAARNSRPSGVYPRRPEHPDYDSPLYAGPPRYGPAGGHPFSVGGDDLDPFHGNAPSSLGPYGPGGMMGPSGFGYPGGGGGMQIGPHHPGFGRGVLPPFSSGGGGGGGGGLGRGRGNLPHGVPPGARFDPYGPPGVPGEPEPDHEQMPQGPGMPPPGYGNYFL